jgi:hypothetical protein
MPTIRKNVNVEYMCRYCGARTVRTQTSGRPLPGNCSRRPKNSMGKYQPHSWVISRKF